MSLAGRYDCIIASPLGDQPATLTLAVDGTVLTGSAEGAFGSCAIVAGSAEGNAGRWRMEVTSPMRLTLEVRAVLAGDTLVGAAKAGVYGTFKLSGTRIG